MVPKLFLLSDLPLGGLVSHFIEVYLPPTQLFQEKLFLEKVSSLGDKRFALRLIVEGVSTSFLWIAYKDALINL